MTWQVEVSAVGVYGLGYHVVLRPRYGRAVLGGGADAWCDELIRAKAGECGWRMVALEIVPGHVHLLVKAHRSGSPSHVANQFKGFTSCRLRAGFPHLRSRLPMLWSGSYVAATADAVPAETAGRYIGTQAGWRWRKGRAG